MPDTLLEAVNPVLRSADVPTSLRFFAEKLDFDVTFQDSDDPTFAIIGRDRVEIHIRKKDEHSTLSEIRIAVCDVEHLHSQLEPLEILTSGTTLQNTPFGTREFTILDPDGNSLTFYSELGE